MTSPLTAPASITFKQRLAVFFATGFGLGYSPVMSGTVGSIPGVIIAYYLLKQTLSWQVGVAAALALLAIPICHAAEPVFKKKDDGRIVADEYMTFPLCVIGLSTALAAHPSFWAVAFVTNRALDIIKPAPARQIQKVPGGPGIVLDDIVSSLYSLALNHGLYYCFSRWVY
jgi:phosphatidylglycerophosphatase A